jgi:hypothetical protein
MELSNIFKKINFLYEPNYADKKAEKFLIKKLGLEKTKQLAEYAVKIQGQNYTPVITCPAQLLEKLSRLIVYAKKEQNNKPRII